MKPFSLLIKPVGGVCNIDCAYCFYKRALDMYEPRTKHQMSQETLEALVSKYLGLGYPRNAFCFQGGEPTLAGLDFFKSLVRTQQKHGNGRQEVSNSMQTHGMNLTDEWGRFFARYKFFLGVSVDGPAELHNHYRKTYGGNETHERVINGIRVLRRWNVDFNVLCLLSQSNVHHPRQVWEYFGNEGFDHVQFIPCIEYHGDTGEPREFAIRPEEYGEFLATVFDLWEKDSVGKRSVRIFDNVLEHMVRQKPTSCFFNDSCDSYFMVEHNGDVFPCDFFGFPEWRLGNINDTSWENLADSEKRNQFAANKSRLHPKCRECDYVAFCQGACPSHRLRHEGLSYFCEGYKIFYGHVWERMESIRDRHLQHLLPPPPPAGESSREPPLHQVGTGTPARNRPCPCGSGKKYKHCCMNKAVRR